MLINLHKININLPQKQSDTNFPQNYAHSLSKDTVQFKGSSAKVVETLNKNGCEIITLKLKNGLNQMIKKGANETQSVIYDNNEKMITHQIISNITKNWKMVLSKTKLNTEKAEVKLFDTFYNDKKELLAMNIDDLKKESGIEIKFKKNENGKIEKSEVLPRTKEQVNNYTSRSAHSANYYKS